MLGSAFRGTLREAQAGDEQAFTRLWRDANPLMVRYLRVIGAEDPYDAACEGWITAVRGLTGYTGDEDGWRVWLLACARLRAEEGSERQHWATVTPIDRRAFSSASRASGAASAATAGTAAILAMRGQADDEFDHSLGELLDGSPDTDPEHRGLADTITALRALPLGQGEILVLRLGGGLPVSSVSDVVGSDMETVRRSEARALERLGTGAELLAWSLDAPATAAELADERVALGAFRSIPRPPAWSVPRTRVVTVGAVPSRQGNAQHGRGISNAAGRSRTALLGIAMVSASVMSLGGLSAAAYVGALPEGVQRVMHDTIGAPAPGATRGGAKQADPGSPRASGRPGASTPVGPNAAASPAAGLCQAWASDKTKGTARSSSVAFRNLAAAAGGEAKVDAYCQTVQAQGAKPAPTAQGTAPVTGGKPTQASTGAPTSTRTKPVPHGTGSPTRTPVPDPTSTDSPSTPTPRTPTSKTPNSNSTKTKAPSTSSTRTKTPPAKSSGASGVSMPDAVSTTAVTTPAG